jgi:sRNA-binding protein
MMENMRRMAERRRNIRAVKRNTQQRRYKGAKSAAQEKAEMRNRPAAPSADVVPATARISEMKVAAHNTISALETTRIAGASLLPKTFTLSPW